MGRRAADNPFAGPPGLKPEIFALGIRNAMGMIVHPDTGEIWKIENGPQGGDEINIIRAGKNCGWPMISYGRSRRRHHGKYRTRHRSPVKDGLEQPLLFWSPSIALSGMTIYTGDRSPEWKGGVFVGGLVGEQLQLVVMNQRGLPIRRACRSTSCRQRIREVRQGPDGLVYLLTDEKLGPPETRAGRQPKLRS